MVAFSLLSTTTTPWPLPPNCRVLLVGLDDYKGWFPSGKRADLLAVAIDPEENGVHVAAIEVKARRSDAQLAGAEALDQLRQTLAVTRWAAYPVAGSIHSRLWLNRIAEAAYSVVRESLLREGRSKGLSVILATQQPGDLPDVVATNAATKACFRLPDATVAAAAARRLDPSDPTLPEQIRTLGVGEAFVSLGGGAPACSPCPSSGGTATASPSPQVRERRRGRPACPVPGVASPGVRRSMRGNRRVDTKPEIALRSALRCGLRFRKDLRLDLDYARVRPDIVFTRRRVAVFVDGCFWHCCPNHYSPPKPTPGTGSRSCGATANAT